MCHMVTWIMSINYVAITPTLQIGKPRPRKKSPDEDYTICDLNDRDSNLGFLTPGIQFPTPVQCYFPLQGANKLKHRGSEGVYEPLQSYSEALTILSGALQQAECLQFRRHFLAMGTSPGIYRPRGQATCTSPWALLSRAEYVSAAQPICILEFKRKQQ